MFGPRIMLRCDASWVKVAGEVEPLGVYLIESITGSNIRFYYKSGEDREKV
jgi:hypothetical protein